MLGIYAKRATWWPWGTARQGPRTEPQDDTPADFERRKDVLVQSMHEIECTAYFIGCVATERSGNIAKLSLAIGCFVMVRVSRMWYLSGVWDIPPGSRLKVHEKLLLSNIQMNETMGEIQNELVGMMCWLNIADCVGSSKVGRREVAWNKNTCLGYISAKKLKKG